MRSDIHYQKEPKMLQEIVYAAQVKMKAVISITINKKKTPTKHACIPSLVIT